MGKFEKQCRMESPELDCNHFEKCFDKFQESGRILVRLCEVEHEEPSVLSYITDEELKLVHERSDYE